MLKFVSKFVLDILPSVVATIVGAYIVNHYIIPKAGSDKPAAAVASTPDPKADSKAASAKPAETSSDVANVPDPAPTKTKGEKPVVDKASIEKSEKSETASAPAETRRHQPAIREKAVAKVAPPAAPVAPPPVATASVAPTETPPTPEERRDANDLARAAIERLRVSEPQQRPQEAPRVPEAPRVQDAARAVSPPQQVQQLPPPIMVSTPSIETYGSLPSRPPYAPTEQTADPRRPRPPGEIPTPPPLDLQADATGSTRPDRPSVAEDVLSAAKSVFHSVIPRQFER
jgi:hypothetical protein